MAEFVRQSEAEDLQNREQKLLDAVAVEEETLKSVRALMKFWKSK